MSQDSTSAVVDARELCIQLDSVVHLQMTGLSAEALMTQVQVSATALVNEAQQSGAWYFLVWEKVSGRRIIAAQRKPIQFKAAKFAIGASPAKSSPSGGSAKSFF